MLEKVEVAPRLVFRVIGLLLLTGVINKLSAFPEIDMNMERLARGSCTNSTLLTSQGGIRPKSNANISSLLMLLI